MSTAAPHQTALADQLHAASAHADQIIRAVAATGHATLTRHTPPPWLAAHLTALSRALATGHGRLCPHIGPGPQVVHAAVWAPGQLTCTACVRLLTPAPAEDATCDHCRRHARHLRPAVVAFGPILLGYGLCRRCHTNPRTR